MARVHAANGLPSACLPDVDAPIFIVKQCAEIDGKLALAACVRVTGEAYLLLDHSVGTPEQRWKALVALTESIEAAARLKGLEDICCFVPLDLAKAFGKRLEKLGFVASDWKYYGKKL